MNRRIHLVAIGWVGALAGLTLLTLALTANTPVQAIMADSSISVSVTENGFAPSVVTITVGTTVVWTNRTQETGHLVSGEPYRIYLPLVLRNASDTRVTATSPPMAGAVVTRRKGNWGNVDIAPGKSYTHTFATAGNHPYFLAGHPDRTGLVVVQEAPAPDFALGVQPLAQEVAQGGSVTYTVKVMALHGFADSVALDVGGAPTGTTVSWATNPVTPSADTTLTITTSASGPTGTSTLVITGTGGERVHTMPFTLTVISSSCPQTGSWSGTTSQGRSISLTVSDTSGCQVERLTINLLCPTFLWLASMGPEPITDNHFEAYERNDYFGWKVTVIGDFTSSTVVSGTWYSNASCYGTWAANYTP